MSEHKTSEHKTSEHKTSEHDYTELEKKEINKLSLKIKGLKPNIENIKPITDNMVHLLNNDDDLKSVYNKKTVLLASLRKLVKKYELDEKHEKYIDKRLFEEDVKHLKKSKCCKDTCIIF